MTLSAQDRLVANLDRRRRRCRNKRRLSYAGVAALLTIAAVLGYADRYSDVDLIVPLGPFLLAVALSRILWGMRAARLASVIVGIIAVGDLAESLYDGEFAFWSYCLAASLSGFVIAGRAA